ncbi:MAG: CPBP family intramembrane metalloprotease [Peptococcaceae bacterium]|nr:CPBP family intramembrane metalloprotease [Peptococcaceae bacterium]
MKKIINWKTFIILSITCAITTMLVIPYQAALIPELVEDGVMFYILAFVQGLIMFSVVTFIGLFLAPKVGFGLLVLSGGESKWQRLKVVIMPSILFGVLSGVLIVLGEYLVFQAIFTVPISLSDTHVPIWTAFLASFYGGIAEEVLLRLFVMTLFVWLISKFKKNVEGLPTNWSIWLAMILASILFGLGHLPATSEMTDITVAVVARAVVLNGIGGIVFGWLFWKKGLVSAIIAHFSADIVLHIITPIVIRTIT